MENITLIGGGGHSRTLIDLGSSADKFRMIGRNSTGYACLAFGNSAFIVVGSNIIQDISVGENALVTAGSIIIKDVGENQKVRGIQGR